MRILIIDDSELDIELITTTAVDSGIVAEFDTAHCKEEIRTALETKKYDIIICDYDIRDTNAMEVLALCKELSIDVPFIGMSGVVTEQKLVELVRAGACGFFLKRDIYLLPQIIFKERQDFLTRMEETETARSLKLFETLKSRGEMLSGPAEELTRLCNIIIGQLDIIAKNKTPQTVIESLELAKEAAGKALKIALNLLLSSGKTTKPEEIIDFATLFKDNAYYFEMLVPETISLTINVPPDLPHIYGDTVMLRHAIGAIITNAVEAIYDSASEARNILVQASSNATEVILSITDTGRGIEKEILDRIFEPFFTTKIRAGGFGLAATFGIVSKHQGHVKVESVPGMGSTLFLHFPILKTE